MGKISTYITDSNVTLADKVIGTDAENSNETKNYLLSDVYNLFSAQSVPEDFGSPIFQPNIIEYSSSTCGGISLDLYVGGSGSWGSFGSTQIQAPYLASMYFGIVLIGDYNNGSSTNYVSQLESITMPVLNAVGLSMPGSETSIDIEAWWKLETIDFGNLSFVGGGSIYIMDNIALTNLDLSYLYNVSSGGINIYNNPLLSSIDLTNLTLFNGNFNMSNNSLDQTSVDSILNQLANVVILSGQMVSLDGGTNSTPSITGLANVAILTANGCVVTHN